MSTRRAAKASANTGSFGRSLALLFAVLIAALGACHSEVVIPFPDAGDPCSGSDGDHIDCARFPETTCGGGGTTCPRTIYGCADGGYFSQTDYSECPPEGGGRDAMLLGDVSLIAPDAATGPETPDGSDGGDEPGD
jgi:hypothetical protein